MDNAFTYYHLHDIKLFLDPTKDTANSQTFWLKEYHIKDAICVFTAAVSFYMYTQLAI